jgi:hypothetical protein
MTWIEDPSIFLGMDAKPVTAGAVSGLGILDQNSEIILGGEITIIDYLLTVPTATFGSLAYGDLVTVDGTSYKAETQPQRFDDGMFCRVALVPFAAAARYISTLSGLAIKARDGRVLATRPGS